MSIGLHRMRFRVALSISVLGAALGCDEPSKPELAPSRHAGSIIRAGRPKRAAFPEKLEQLVEDSLRLDTRSAAARSMTVGATRIGGLPDLPLDEPWPVHAGRPLAFIAQLRLDEISKTLPSRELPERGYLFFFYDASEQPWGYSAKDRGSWRVVYRDVPVARLRPRAAPRGLEPAPFPPQLVRLETERSYPDPDSHVVELVGLGAREDKEYRNFLEQLDKQRPELKNRVLGHPDAIQGDMQLECQLTSNGIDTGDQAGYLDPRRKQLEPGAADWRLLLQIDSNDDAEMSFGDAGRIYYFIRRQDLRAKNFDNVWLILQCY